MAERRKSPTRSRARPGPAPPTLGPMELIPPTLADMGGTLYGEGWKTALATSLNVFDDDVQAWEADPTTIPANMEAEIHKLGLVRIEEIQFMLAHMKETSLNRKPASE
jgi:hypothetical protein